MKLFKETYNKYMNKPSSINMDDPIKLWSNIVSQLETTEQWRTADKEGLDEVKNMILAEIESSGLNDYQKQHYKIEIKELNDWIQLSLFLDQQLRGF